MAKKQKMNEYDSRMDRRRFLQLTGKAAVALGAGGLLAAYGPKEAVAKKSKLAVYANKSMAFFFFVALDETIKRAVKELGYEYQSTNPEFDAIVQAENFNSLLLKSPAMLISNPVSSEILAPITEKYKKAGIPHAVVDSPLSVGHADITVAYDNFQGGVDAAQKIVDLLTKRYGKPRGKVLNAYGSLVPEAWRLRYEGWNRVFSDYPGIQNIGRPTQGSEENARAITEATLAEHPDLDAAHAPSDTLTRGVINALKAAKRLVPKGEDGHVIITTIDGEPMALDWVRKGIIDASVSQDPVAYGQIAVEMLTKYTMQGKEIPVGETYVNDKYYWERAPIKMIKGIAGPVVNIPPYYIETPEVADDPRQWGNVVTKEWGLKA
jgi:simple sugar transport system substrate-binding protein